LGLAFAKGLVDANEVPLAHDVEGLSGVHWRLCGCLGGAAAGGGEEAAGHGRDPERQEGLPPTRRSGKEDSTERRRAAPNHQHERERERERAAAAGESEAETTETDQLDGEGCVGPLG
jgi:hypothetical protein